MPLNRQGRPASLNPEINQAATFGSAGASTPQGSPQKAYTHNPYQQVHEEQGESTPQAQQQQRTPGTNGASVRPSVVSPCEQTKFGQPGFEFSTRPGDRTSPVPLNRSMSVDPVMSSQLSHSGSFGHGGDSYPTPQTQPAHPRPGGEYGARSMTSPVPFNDRTPQKISPQSHPLVSPSQRVSVGLHSMSPTQRHPAPKILSSPASSAQHHLPRPEPYARPSVPLSDPNRRAMMGDSKQPEPSERRIPFQQSFPSHPTSIGGSPTMPQPPLATESQRSSNRNSKSASPIQNQNFSPSPMRPPQANFTIPQGFQRPPMIPPPFMSPEQYCQMTWLAQHGQFAYPYPRPGTFPPGMPDSNQRVVESKQVKAPPAATASATKVVEQPPRETDDQKKAPPEKSPQKKSQATPKKQQKAQSTPSKIDEPPADRSTPEKPAETVAKKPKGKKTKEKKETVASEAGSAPPKPPTPKDAQESRPVSSTPVEVAADPEAESKKSKKKKAKAKKSDAPSSAGPTPTEQPETPPSKKAITKPVKVVARRGSVEQEVAVPRMRSASAVAAPTVLRPFTAPGRQASPISDDDCDDARSAGTPGTGHEFGYRLSYTLVQLPECEREKDTHRMAQRRRQINFGKSTEGYKKYVAMVPKCKRQFGNDEHPVTPRVDLKTSKRKFDTTLGQWRRSLHLWDDVLDPSQHHRSDLKTLGELGLEPQDDVEEELRAETPMVSTPSGMYHQASPAGATFKAVSGQQFLGNLGNSFPHSQSMEGIDLLTPSFDASITDDTAAKFLRHSEAKDDVLETSFPPRGQPPLQKPRPAGTDDDDAELQEQE